MANLKLVDAFTDFVEESTLPYRQMMTYYNCALMEVETKFKVLNEQFSLFYDRNPIESIHTRIKSQSSILKKLQKKNLALSQTLKTTYLILPVFEWYVHSLKIFILWPTLFLAKMMCA